MDDNNTEMDENNSELASDEIQSTPIDNDAKAVNIGSGVRVDGRIEGAETSDISGTLTGTLKSSNININSKGAFNCLLYTSPSPRDRTRSRMPSSA